MSANTLLEAVLAKRFADAITPVQVALGITPSDYAAQHFADERISEKWERMDEFERCEVLCGYLKAEIHYGLAKHFQSK